MTCFQSISIRPDSSSASRYRSSLAEMASKSSYLTEFISDCLPNAKNNNAVIQSIDQVALYVKPRGEPNLLPRALKERGVEQSNLIFNRSRRRAFHDYSSRLAASSRMSDASSLASVAFVLKRNQPGGTSPGAQGELTCASASSSHRARRRSATLAAFSIPALKPASYNFAFSRRSGLCRPSPLILLLPREEAHLPLPGAQPYAYRSCCRAGCRPRRP